MNTVPDDFDSLVMMQPVLLCVEDMYRNDFRTIDLAFQLSVYTSSSTLLEASSANVLEYVPLFL